MMSSGSATPWVVAACTGLAGFLAFAPFVRAAERITSRLESRTVGKLTDGEWRSLSLAAGRVLMHADRARTEIAEGKLDQAEDDVEKGMTLVQIIESAAPEYQVSATISAGNLVYRDREDIKAGLIPIYDELDQVDLSGALARAKEEIVAQRGRESTEPAALANALEFTSVDLDVPIAESGLKLADEALKRDDTHTADAALRTVQRAAVFRYDESELPLAQAADRLKSAESDFARGDNDAAGVALHSASDALKRYEKVAGETRATEVRKLHMEIDAMNQDLSRNAEQASRLVSGWWDRVVAWFHK